MSAPTGRTDFIARVVGELGSNRAQPPEVRFVKFLATGITNPTKVFPGDLIVISDPAGSVDDRALRYATGISLTRVLGLALNKADTASAVIAYNPIKRGTIIEIQRIGDDASAYYQDITATVDILGDTSKGFSRLGASGTQGFHAIATTAPLAETYVAQTCLNPFAFVMDWNTGRQVVLGKTINPIVAAVWTGASYWSSVTALDV